MVTALRGLESGQRGKQPWLKRRGGNLGWRMHVVNFLSTQFTNLEDACGEIFIHTINKSETNSILLLIWRILFMALTREDTVLLFFTTQTATSSMSILDIFCFAFFSRPYFITVTSCSWTPFYGFRNHGPLSNSMLNEFSTKIKLLCHF